MRERKLQCKFFIMSMEFDKNISDWSHDCTDHKNGNDFFMSLVKWPKIAVKKAKIFWNFRNKSRLILMLHKIDKNKKVAPKLIFFNEITKFFLERFEGYLMLKIDFDNQILALFDLYFWPFNKPHENSNTIFVISAIIASIWNVYIKFRWYDEKLTPGLPKRPLSGRNRSLTNSMDLLSLYSLRKVIIRTFYLYTLWSLLSIRQSLVLLCRKPSTAPPHIDLA